MSAGSNGPRPQDDERLPLREHEIESSAGKALEAAIRIAKIGVFLTVCAGRPARYQRTRYEVARMAARARVHERSELAVLRRLLRPGHVTLDVGANYGVYTRAMSELVGPSGEVHAFEPQKDVIEVLRSELATTSGVHLINAGVSDAPGWATVRVPKILGIAPEPARASIQSAQPADVASSAGTVQLVTLDDYCAGFERLDFVKVDAEGHDAAVLRGARTTLRRFRPIVQVEAMEVDDAVRCGWSTFGYRPYVVLGGMLVEYDLAVAHARRRYNVYLLPPGRTAVG